MDTSTRPIINGEILSAKAIFTECSTALSLETAISTIPKTRPTIATITSKGKRKHSLRVLSLGPANYLSVFNVLIIYNDLILINSLILITEYNNQISTDN